MTHPRGNKAFVDSLTSVVIIDSIGISKANARHSIPIRAYNGNKVANLDHLDGDVGGMVCCFMCSRRIRVCSSSSSNTWWILNILKIQQNEEEPSLVTSNKILTTNKILTWIQSGVHDQFEIT